MTEELKHAGIVLAAGASSRMGFPKALLPLPDNTTLAEHQLQRLLDAGCNKIALVSGCHHREICDRLKNSPVLHNEKWKTGRISSIQAGLQHFPDFDGYVILSVDTFDVKVDTLRTVISYAIKNCANAVRPMYKNERGKILWISGKLAKQMLSVDSSEVLRFDTLVEPFEQCVCVEDEAILHNINTLEEWRRINEQ